MTKRILNRLGPLLVVAVFYSAVALIEPSVGWQNNTFKWTAARVLWLLVLVSLIAAWRGGRRGALWSVAGYLVGVFAGELIGNYTYDLQVAKLAEQKLDPDYIQNWEPSHPGWWISLLVFLGCSVLGAVMGRRALRRDDSGSAGP